jgi:NADPH:quinone reductase-like Zn-dependent oxidoreductase
MTKKLEGKTAVIDVLEVRDVPRPVPAAGEVLVEVRAAGINPSEAVIRSGALHHLFPATFPSGQGFLLREVSPIIPAPYAEPRIALKL